MPAFFVRPDVTWDAVHIVGSFEVDADIPGPFVRACIFPEKAKAFIDQMARRGYQHQGGVYLFPRSYAVTETSDDDTVTAGVYEEDEAKRARVSRKMLARFLVRKPIVYASNLPEPSPLGSMEE